MNQSHSDTPLIGILLAVYNAEKHLEALLSSLVGQDYPHVQIHVRDNCSTDKTCELLEKWQRKYPEKIKLHFSEKNVGVIGNFSELTELGDTPYLMYCDGDDIWLPAKVSKTLEKMQQLEEEHGTSMPLLVHTDLVVVDENLKVIAPSFWKYSKLNTHEKCQQLPRLLVQNHVTGCTMMINRSLKEFANPIPLNCVMHDWWLALVAACFGRVDILSEATLLYRQHNLNDTGAKPYNLFGCFKQQSNSKNFIQGKKIDQVLHFIERYNENLSDYNRKLLIAYLQLQNASLPEKIVLIFRYGFFKSGFLRNFIFNH